MKFLKSHPQKIILTIVFSLIIIFTLLNIAYAAKPKDDISQYKKGKDYDLEGLTYLENHSNTFCVDHGGTLKRSTYYKFHVFNIIKITGNFAINDSSDLTFDDYEYKDGKYVPKTDKNGNTIKVQDKGNENSTNVHNARLAYILATQKDGYGKLGNYSKGQIAVWKTWNDFAKALGFKSWNSDLNDESTKAVNSKNNSVWKDAINYSNNVEEAMLVNDDGLIDNTKFNDNITNQKRVTTELKKWTTNKLDYADGLKANDDNDYYVRVGPFNWEFNGDISITVKNEKGQDISEKVKYFKYYSKENEKTGKIGNASNIVKTGKDFYILLNPNEPLVTKLNITVKVKNSETLYEGKVVMLRAVGNQRLIVGDFDKAKPREAEAELTYTLNTADLQLTKIDAYNNKLYLEGAEFTLKHKETGLYVSQNKDKQIIYIKQDSLYKPATFTTDSMGKIVIKGLVKGEYIAEEVKAPTKINKGQTTNNYELQSDSNKNSISINLIPKTTEEVNRVNMYNPQTEKKVKVSGYVWAYDKEGKAEEAITANDSLYKNTRDSLLKGLKVELYRYRKLELKYNENGELLPIDESRDMIDIPNGELVATAGTNENGYYEFNTANIRYPELELKYYRVKFTYDGMDYQACNPNYNDNNLPNTNKVNGTLVGNSKATEDSSSRNNLNQNFAIVSGTENNDLEKGYARNSSGQKTANLTYEYEEGENGKGTSTLKNISQIGNSNVSKVVTAEYNLMKGQPNGNPGAYKTYWNDINNNSYYGEVVRINLGLIPREMPDLSVTNQIENVVTTINGYNNLYKTTATKTNLDPNNSDLKVGVSYVTDEDVLSQFKVYPSDVKTWSNDNVTNKLQVYVTYKIGITNNATSELYNKVRELAIYYDPGYELVYAGKDLDQNKSNYCATNNLGKGSNKYNENSKYSTYTITGQKNNQNAQYNKAYIDLSDYVISKNSTQNLYVTYKVSDDEVKNMLTDGEINNYVPTMNNIIEINAYSTYSDEKGTKLYAGVDKDSAAGNMTNINQIDDDTDRAKEFTINHEGTRTMTGTVFLDKSENDDLATGQERKGDSIYNEEEDKKLQNVTVTLKGKDGTSKNMITGENVTIKGQTYNAVYNSKTDDNDGVEGNNTYKISGFVPGDYVIEYTYNNKTYYEEDNKEVNINTIDYKSATVTNVEGKTSVRTAFENGTTDWYKLDNPKKQGEEGFVRYNEAVDDWQTRKSIDEEYKNMNMDNTGSTVTTNTSMTASTPTMGVSVELDTITSDNTYIPAYYNIINMDFGITERPRQKLQLDKQVSSVKVILSDGQVLMDANIVTDKNGNRTLKEKVNGMKLVGTSASTPRGLLDIELDSELIHGATLEIGYEIKVTNVSEVDYSDKEYYEFGTGGTTPVTIVPGKIVDYTNNELTFDKQNAENSSYKWDIVNIENNESEDNDSVLKISDKVKAQNTTLYTDVKTNEIKKSNINTIVSTIYLSDKDGLATGQTSETIKLNLTKLLSNTDEDMTYNNDVEILTASKGFGRRIETQIGTYSFDTKSGIGGSSEDITITPPTGSTDSNTLYYVIGATIALVIVAGAISFVIVKRKNK